jgi:predicted Fe-Mo cluster-binding NifX family protein
MRIAIPVNDKSMKSDVCPSFGRAPYFLFYNTVTGEEEFLDNSAVASQGGAGIRAAQFIADRGTQALITERCGENAAEVLTKAEVMIYRPASGTVEDNIEAYKSNELFLLETFHKGHHGHA